MTLTKNMVLRFGLAVLACLAFPVTAGADIIEMGQLDDAPEAGCPEKPCLALTRATAFQKRIAGEEDVYTVPKSGRIVAWTIRLGSPDDDQIAYFEKFYGGGPQANITVFRIGTKKPNKGIGTNIGQSGVQDLEPYYGQTVQFPMINSLRVRAGDRVALTVPTWAPADAGEQPTNTVFRATRDPDSCTDYTAQRAIQQAGTMTAFGCSFPSERLLYGATLVTGPVPNKSSGSKDGGGKGKAKATPTPTPTPTKTPK